jgi:hypothetical protein
MVAKVAWLFRLNIGPVLHMNGRVQELLWGHTVILISPVLRVRFCLRRIKRSGYRSIQTACSNVHHISKLSFRWLLTEHHQVNFWRTTIYHQCGLLNFIHFPTHSGNTFLQIGLRRGWRCRRLCVDEHRDSKMDHCNCFIRLICNFFRGVTFYMWKFSPCAQVLFDSRLWFNTEIFSRAPFLNIVFQIWAYITSSKEHKVCLARIVMYVFRCWFTNRWCLRLHIWYVIAFPLYEQDFQRAACAVHFNRQRVMRLMRHRGKG